MPKSATEDPEIQVQARSPISDFSLLNPIMANDTISVSIFRLLRFDTTLWNLAKTAAACAA